MTTESAETLPKTIASKFPLPDHIRAGFEIPVCVRLIGRAANGVDSRSLNCWW